MARGYYRHRKEHSINARKGNIATFGERQLTPDQLKWLENRGWKRHRSYEAGQYGDKTKYVEFIQD